MRLYLTGRVSVERGDRLLEERRLPGRQGRRALVYLALERGRRVPQDELADAIWGEVPPPAWETALSVLSKLRGLLGELGLSPRDAIGSASGCYQLRLPPGAWVDVEAARQSLDAAEGALRRGRPRAAWGPANVAAAIARRPLLPGIDAEWVERRRDALQQMLVRALDCLADLALPNREHPLAAQLAAEAIGLEPFRESGYQRLMRARAAAGDRAEALRVYEQCRRLLADQLGVAPSPETEALRRALLRGVRGDVS